jgi:hypothetical protein
MTTYCLDIAVGYNESYRDELIALLQQSSAIAQFELSGAQRGMWQGVKKLRVLTPKAIEFQQFLYNNLRTGDDNDYTIYDNAVEANRSMTWLPDLDSPHGYAWFEITGWVAPPAGFEYKTTPPTWDDDSTY